MIRLLFLSLIVFSCATGPSKKKGGFATVDLSVDKKDKAVTIERNNQKFDGSYGPSIKGELELKQKSKQVSRDPIIAIHLAPAGYHASGYISFFRKLEKEKIRVNAISAEGFSSVIAALYAKYHDSNRLEWKTYALYGRLKGLDMYSTKWSRELSSFLKEEFKNSRMEQQKSLLIIPLIHKGQLKTYSTGKIRDIVSAAVKLDGDALTSSLLNKKVVFKSEIKEKAAADLVYQITILPDRISFKKPSGYIWGVYSKKAYQLAQSGESFYRLATLGSKVDELSNISAAVKITRDASEKISQDIALKIEEWKSQNNI
jgi:hypothetical protein